MRSIWKFEIGPRNLRVMMPVGAKLLTAQIQNNSICVWAEVDTKAEREEVIFEIFGTGHSMPWNMGVDREYVGTVQFNNGDLVLHIYKWTGI
jgi:hypothetical protein